jgi:hypothetical protein
MHVRFIQQVGGGGHAISLPFCIHVSFPIVMLSVQQLAQCHALRPQP